MFDLLGRHVGSMMGNTKRDEAERNTLDNMVSTLSHAFLSKIDSIVLSACRFFHVLFNEILQLKEKNFSRMMMSKVLLLDDTFMDNLRLGLSNDTSKSEIFAIPFQIGDITYILKQDAEKTCKLGDKDRILAIKFYLHILPLLPLLEVREIIEPFRQSICEPIVGSLVDDVLFIVLQVDCNFAK